MGTIKMRLKFHDVEIEIEGAESIVKKEFEIQKQFILSQVNTTRSAPQSTNTISTSAARISAPDADSLADMPSLDTFAAQNVAGTESDWIMGYAMYVTKGSERPFTLKDLRDLYRSTGRAVVKRMNNIRNNMKTLLNKGLFIESAPGEFTLSKSGIRYGRQLLSGKAPSKFAKDTKKPAKRGRVAKPKAAAENAPKRKAGFELNDEDKKTYTTFVRSKKPVKAAERVAVATKWFTDHTGNPSIGMDELRTLLTTTGKLPGAFGAVISQMKGKADSIVTAPSRGRLSLSDAGASLVEAMPNSGKSKTKKAKKSVAAVKAKRTRKPKTVSTADSDTTQA